MKKRILVLFIVLIIFIIGCSNTKQIKININSSNCGTKLTPSNYFFPDKSDLIKRLYSSIEIKSSNSQKLELYKSVGRSMQPTIGENNYIISLKVPKEEINLGDIITFENEDSIKTVHRVIEIKEELGKTLYTTKGDNNFIKDTKILTYEDIEEKVIGVLY